MSGVDVIAYALTIAALAALTLLGLRVWRQTPERVTTRGLAGTAALTAVSALLAGYLLTMAQPFPVHVGLVIYARVSVLASVALAGLAIAHATRSTRRADSCDPCREPHEAADCIDTKAGREYPWRHCACQHKPRIIDPKESNRE